MSTDPTSGTAGPWTAHGRGVFAGDVHVATSAHPRDIEEHPDGRYPDYDSSLANARLMAAAPDLLAALKEVVRLSDRKHDAWDAARIAIAKAEGSDQLEQAGSAHDTYPRPVARRTYGAV